MLMSQMLEDPKWSPNVSLNGDLCGICPLQEPNFKLLEAVDTFFPGWSVGNWTCMHFEIGSRQPPQYDSFLRYFHPWNIWEKFSGSVAAHEPREVREVRWVNGCPVELLCITAETTYYRNAPSIFRVSCEIQRWIPMAFCLNSSGKYKFEVFEVAMLCYGTSPGFLATSQPSS